MNFLSAFVQLVLLSMAFVNVMGEAAVIGCDGSNPPSRTSWRIARVYQPLKVVKGKDVSFSWTGAQGLKLAANLEEFENCAGEGTLLVPDYSAAGSYIFSTGNVEPGKYYFYNPQKNGLYCKTNMKVVVEVLATRPCSSAKNAKSCKQLSQCQWRAARRTCSSTGRG